MADQPRATRRTMVALALLGFSSGLPYHLSGKTLQVWLKRDGIDVAAIGWLALTTLPYSLKFLVAPLVDRFAPPWLGRRRGWIAALQIACAGAIAAMAFAAPAGGLATMAVAATALAAASALQDVAIDACRADALDERDAAAGVSLFLLGYRLALLLALGGALAIAARLTERGLALDAAWRWTYLAIAAAMAIGAAGTAVMREPPRPERAPVTLREAVLLPAVDFVRRLGAATAAWTLLFCVLYRLPDALAGGMTNPFLVELGFSDDQIAAVASVFGIATTIAGTIVGGIALRRIDSRRGLVAFGALQGLSCLGYVALARAGRSLPLMATAVLVEDFCAGLVTAAFLGFLTTRCARAYSATQYALLTSLFAFGRTLLTAPAGAIAKACGWPLFFAIAAASAIPALLLVTRCAPRATSRALGGGMPAKPAQR